MTAGADPVYAVQQEAQSVARRAIRSVADRVPADGNDDAWVEAGHGGVAGCKGADAVGREVGDDVVVAVGQSEGRRLGAGEVSGEGDTAGKARGTCLEQLQCAVALGVNVVGDVEARAVVVIETVPGPLALRLDARRLLRVPLLEPVVAQQQLRGKCILEPGVELHCHVKRMWELDVDICLGAGRDAFFAPKRESMVLGDAMRTAATYSILLAEERDATLVRISCALSRSLLFFFLPLSLSISLSPPPPSPPCRQLHDGGAQERKRLGGSASSPASITAVPMRSNHIS